MAVVGDVVYTGMGLFTETGTGGQVVAEFSYLALADGGLLMEVAVDGKPTPAWPLTVDQAGVIAAWFAPGGGGGVAKIADPVNIDGSPRNSLRDRLARRQLPTSSLAAVVAAIGGAMLRCGMGSGIWCNLAGGIWTMG